MISTFSNIMLLFANTVKVSVVQPVVKIVEAQIFIKPTQSLEEL